MSCIHLQGKTYYLYQISGWKTNIYDMLNLTSICQRKMNKINVILSFIGTILSIVLSLLPLN